MFHKVHQEINLFAVFVFAENAQFSVYERMWDKVSY